MKILVINCGSSSIKYGLFRADRLEDYVSLACGAVSGLGRSDGLLTHETGGRAVQIKLDRPDYRKGLEAILAALSHPEHGVVAEPSEIGLVGHRAVHGGESFTEAVIIDREVIARMKQCIPLAPIHNPANLEGIRQARTLLPRAWHVAVFDTAFHHTLPARAYMYAIPYELYQRHGIRKYGFHGTSCRYVCQQAGRLLRRPPESIRIVICHIGNGVTVAAVRGNRSVDTSLGFTPLEGVMMGTRCGDLDPGVVLYLQRELGMIHTEVDKMLNRESGLLGISGLSNDMRTILAEAREGDARCALAVEMFTYRLKKYIGAYAAAMGGIDMVAFAGGIGENSPLIRERVLQDMGFLGVELDLNRNAEVSRQDRIISPEGAGVVVAVVHTNEEIMIAREALALLEGHSNQGYVQGCRNARPLRMPCKESASTSSN